MIELSTPVAVIAELAIVVALYLCINLALKRRREAALQSLDGSEEQIPSARFEFAEQKSEGVWQRMGNLLKPASDSADYEEIVEMLVRGATASNDSTSSLQTSDGSFWFPWFRNLCLDGVG